MDIGFIGLGNMGWPMASRLAQHGYPVIVYDIRREAVASFQDAHPGAGVGSDPADVAARCEVVLASLPTPESVRETALGHRGVAEGGRARVYIDLSTVGPSTMQQVAEGLHARGLRVLDAPVSGGVPGARQGTLTVMASGPRDLWEEHKPILEVLGRRLFYAGPEPGQAQMLKLVNNLLSATAMAASAEAFVLGVKAGLDPEVMVEVINSGSGRNSATLDKMGQYILNRRFDYGFKTGLMYKDVDLCLQEARRMGMPMWVASHIHQVWHFAVTQGLADEDFTTIVKPFEAWAKVEVFSQEGPTSFGKKSL
ncbi:MAG: NAD(P)-dependent oxidoreductase [Alicyclobacillus macrosporangiidus]|uniref:NAD(P)-dependent oxidoreductase n=1 Tax=Alicyclobacillus macrosporangiidus TaxID=392015 RepID=UPI0026EAC4C7|nr:NAD(P)-dependent oxidoreductase [Alicyclobacillus macrosporangiidus]MCL6599177.1 NAD(P)-dependent oxidoreductase [Alicyclobacillus macrosporangiidus]